jgi:multidrug efflux pump subunit AcrB
MKTSIILKEERSDIISQLENIKDVATTEERDLTSDENSQVDGLLTEVDNLDAKIERAEKMETIKRNAAVVSGVTSNKVEKEVRDYSFQDALAQAANGRIEGLVKEMDQEARNESKIYWSILQRNWYSFKHINKSCCWNCCWKCNTSNGMD